MRCAEAREHLVAWLDGETDPETRERLESHLAGCDACQRERAAFESTGDILKMLAAPVPKVDLAARVLAAAKAGEDPWCRHIRRELVAFADGELSDTEARPVREHLAECAACESERVALVRTGELLSAWIAPTFETDLVARLPIERPRRRGRLLRLAPALAAASVLVIAGLSGFILFRSEPARAEPPIEVLKNFDLLQAESLNLLSEEADILEMAENMEWLDSMTDAELVVLAGTGD